MSKESFAKLGAGCEVQNQVMLGLRYEDGCAEAEIGEAAVVRAFTIIYADVVIGDRLHTGHGALIRERSRLGDDVVVGTGAVVESDVVIGDRVKIESHAYIPSHTRIGCDVFIGPGAVLTNDRYPQRNRHEYTPAGPTLSDGVTVGANATILPGLIIGEGAFIAAGAVVTTDVPAWSMARGVPARISELPESLRHRNRAFDAELASDDKRGDTE